MEYIPVLKYWFGEDLEALKSQDYNGNGKLWFSSNPETDKYMTDNFGNLLKQAEEDKLNKWKEEAKGSLALIILLDQFSRNIYRGSAKMFSNDFKAVKVALELIKSEGIKQLSIPEKKFVYMPFMHSEDLEIHKLSLNCFEELIKEAGATQKPGCEYFLKYAKEHFDVVEKFGRFPHRNQLLGRESTSEEIQFLESSSSGFMKSVNKK